MRFVQNGPIFPNELLSARDEGQVIFFCGSGVSLARAHLPDFYGLADDVLEHLHAASNSRARAVIAASRAVSVRGVEGLIPADRAFSILEQEFDVPRVRAAVAASLKPKVDDLSAHQALIDLSRGTDGEVRLVTTNFDRLFEACDPNIAWHTAPDLPSPNRLAAFKGIMHLHGVLDLDGRAPLEEEFVISSADFGRAYLSEGWATRFIRSLMERYQIVFVGYTANDPPVQYLLEALNTRSATFQPMYALQAGDDELAEALWLHKGVTPIAFNAANNYAALWDSLLAWAERAHDPRGWEADVGDNLTALFRDWVAVLERILPADPELVRAALAHWLRRSDAVANRLTIWTVTAAGLLSDHDAARRLIALNDDGFWDRDHQRDLLHAIVNRWTGFQPSDLKDIEDRILRGPDIYDGETADMHNKRAAYYALERLHWLRLKGCAFTFDFETEAQRLRERCPEWSPRVGEEAANSIEIKVYSVGERTEFDALLDIPIADVAGAALAMDHQRIDVQTVLRPFRGLSRKMPVRSLAALRHAASPPSLRLWEDFLLPDERNETTPRLPVATACVLSALAPADLAHILRPVALWVEKWEAKLRADAPDIEASLWSNLLGALEQHTERAGSAVLTTGSKHDWLMEAINSPTGILAGVAVHQSSTDAPEGLLPACWIDRLRRMVELDGDPGRYAVVTANQNLSFLNARAGTFARDQLLRFKAGDPDDQAAFWTGVFRAQGLSADLHRILNQDIVEAARAAGTGRNETAPLSALLLRCWAIDELRESDDAISANTLREVILDTSDEFRRQLLQIIRRWWREPAWQERALELLQSVWPRQRVARSAGVTDAVATLIIDGDDRFPELLAAAGDLLEPLPGMAATWSYDEKRLKSLAARFPADMLDFLYRVLAEDAANWPFRIEGIVEDLEASVVAKDSRLQELRRRWAARGLWN
ncbi:hypothetical protein GCM10009087_35000 [Sphingomonas oligophenolica]|uniref:SIR2 family protein n=1 Tax=Sphingomonas oligophenolica TaxID=301154 RepID=A0ABU9XZ44_9SPHN